MCDNQGTYPRYKKSSLVVSLQPSQLKSFALPVLSTLAVLSTLMGVSCTKKSSGNPAMLMMMQAAPVRAVSAVAMNVPLNVTAVGTVEAIHSVDVKSQIAGQILRVDFQAGQTVQKGQLLFEIDPAPTLAQIAEIQADIIKDSALERQARANAAKDQATLTQAQAATNRAVALAKAGVISKEQEEQAIATSDAALAALNADKAAIESAVASLNGDRARLAAEQLQLSYTKITAPISGRTGAINLRPGNLVKDNDAVLVTITQISPIYVTFGVPEQLLPEVQKYNARQPLLVSAAGNGEPPVTGKLVFIDNSIDTNTGTVKLKAQFDNPNGKLWPGEFVNTELQLQVQQNRVVVPSQTVENGPQGSYVWVLNPTTETVSIRPVQIARTFQHQGQEESVVAAGLRPGEIVISQGQMRLAPGAKVRLLEPPIQMNGTGQPSSRGSS
jgi:multidrug efflux system membrane fusion protein